MPVAYRILESHGTGETEDAIISPLCIGSDDTKATKEHVSKHRLLSASEKRQEDRLCAADLWPLEGKIGSRSDGSHFG